MLQSSTPFAKSSRILIFGASGGIGSALVRQLAQQEHTKQIVAVARSNMAFTSAKVVTHRIHFDNETALQTLAQTLAPDGPFDLVIVATGILSQLPRLKPEKSLTDLNWDNLQTVFHVNAFLPALIGKYFLPLMHRQHRSIFAVLSARVGSIGDNRQGGWYAYRSSKAALNMFVKNFALEMQRRNNKLIIVALQPGTVATQLSRDFLSRTDPSKVFQPDQAAQYLLTVLHQITPDDNGTLVDWRGYTIPW